MKDDLILVAGAGGFIRSGGTGGEDRPRRGYRRHSVEFLGGGVAAGARVDSRA